MSEGPGYQAGDFEIHPGIAAEVGYDSNYFYRTYKSSTPAQNITNGPPSEPPAATGLLRVTPSVSLTTTPTAQRAQTEVVREPPPVALSAGASGTYREFFASGVQNQRNMSAAANATLSIMPGRPWSGSVMATYTRTIQPTVAGNPDLSYNNDVIVGGVDLATQPGSGTLDWHFGYMFTGTFFEDAGGSPYNNLLHTGYTRGRWKFRPRTALLYDGSISARTFQDPTNALFVQHQEMPVRARLGLEGLVTPRFSILGMAGYGGTFTSAFHPGDPTAAQYDSVIGQLELRFFPGGGNAQPTAADAPAKPSLLVSTIALGYSRDFQASYLNGFVGFDRGYIRAEYFFAGRFLITLEGGVGALEHPRQYFEQSATTATPVKMSDAYTDIGANATVFAEYRVLETLGLNGTFVYNENFSNTQFPATPADVAKLPYPNAYDLNYRRFQAFLGIRWFM